MDLSEEEVRAVINLETYRSGLQQVLEHQKEEYIRHLTLRTTVGQHPLLLSPEHLCYQYI